MSLIPVLSAKNIQQVSTRNLYNHILWGWAHAHTLPDATAEMWKWWVTLHLCHPPCAESVENRLLGQKPQVHKITGTKLHINTQTASSARQTLMLTCRKRQRWCVRRHVEPPWVRVCCRVSSSRQTLLCRLRVGVSQGTVRLPLLKSRARGSAHCSFSILHDTQEPLPLNTTQQPRGPRFRTLKCF